MSSRQWRRATWWTRGGCRSPSSARRRWCSARPREPLRGERRGGRVALLDLGDDHPLDDAAEPEQRDVDIAAHDPTHAGRILGDLEGAAVLDPIGEPVRDRAPGAAARGAI